jgi:hypothetical protein
VAAKELPGRRQPLVLVIQDLCYFSLKAHSGLRQLVIKGDELCVMTHTLSPLL